MVIDFKNAETIIIDTTPTKNGTKVSIGFYKGKHFTEHTFLADHKEIPISGFREPMHYFEFNRGK